MKVSEKSLELNVGAETAGAATRAVGDAEGISAGPNAARGRPPGILGARDVMPMGYWKDVWMQLGGGNAGAHEDEYHHPKVDPARGWGSELGSPGRLLASALRRWVHSREIMQQDNAHRTLINQPGTSAKSNNYC